MNICKIIYKVGNYKVVQFSPEWFEVFEYNTGVQPLLVYSSCDSKDAVLWVENIVLRK